MDQNGFSGAYAVESAGLVTNLLESTNDLVGAFDNAYCLVAFNSAFSREYTRLYGMPPILGQSVAESLPAGDSTRALALCARALSGEAFTVEEEFGPEGQRTWFELRLTPVVGTDGKTIIAAVVARDMTERHIAEGRFTALLEASPDALLIMRADGTIHRINSLAERLFGYEPGTLVGRPLESLLPERLRRLHAQERAHYMARPGTRPMGRRTVELVGLRADGSEFPVDISLNPVRAGDELLVAAAIREAKVQQLSIGELGEGTMRHPAGQARLGAVLDSLSEGVIVSDLEGRVLEMNPAALALHDYSNGQEAHRRLPEYADTFELRSLDGRALALPEWPLSRVLRGEAFTDLELEVRRKDTGKSTIVSYSGTPVRDAHGKAILCVLTTRDVSERKRSEQALRDSEAQLHATFEHAAVGIVHISLPQRRFLRVNEAFCGITGYSRSELMTLTAEDITHPEDRANDVPQYDRLLAGKVSSFAMDKRYVRKDGRVIWVRATISAVRDETGTPRFAVSVIEDVTDARQSEEAREEAEQRLQLAIDIAELGTWEWDAASGRLYLSDLSRRLLGYDEQPTSPDVLRQDWESRLHPEDRARVLDYNARYLADPQPTYEIEYRLRHRDGGYRWFAARALPVRDESGRVAKLIGTQLDITDRKQSEQRVREAALHDPLTGLPNRALVHEYASHLLAATQRSEGHGAFLFIDLDRFKPVNDLYGHEVGDRVLQEVAQRLIGCTRQEDLVGRLGGDEFVIVLPRLETGSDRAAVVAQHVLDAVGRPFRIDALDVSISPSIGISCYPRHGEDLDTLLHAADVAMYHAKQSGRANYQFYTADLERRAGEAQSLEAKLRHALARGGLTLHYQPVMDIRTLEPVGAEALLRLRNDSAVGPESLIPVAEAAGLIGELGEWVAAEACRQHEAWLREGLEVTIAINVSPLQFRQRAFAERLAAIIKEARIDPGCLQVEVTENAVMEGVEEAIGILRQITSLGVKVALDDFGTGFSSLSNLSNLPLDKLKVDQSFVRRIERDRSSQATAKAIIALGRTLNLQIVGEGIESEGTLRYLRNQGCDQAQGFLFSRPLPGEEFARWHRGRTQARPS